MKGGRVGQLQNGKLAILVEQGNRFVEKGPPTRQKESAANQEDVKL